MSHTSASTKRHIREAFTEFSRGQGVYGIRTFNRGQWALAEIGGPEDFQQGGPVKTEFQAFLRIGPAWHRWFADGSSASGDTPDCYGGLGDVIGTDDQLKRYQAHVDNCPSAILALVKVR